MKVSILIPAYNEEKSIRKTVLSCLNQTRKADEIIVVNDGSTDQTLFILKKFKNKIKILDLDKNTGNKSLAQEKGLAEVTGDILITADADTLMDQHFVEHISKRFEDEKVMAVCGYVKSLKHNWLTACREIDYIIGQNIYKTAQAFINYTLVIPGCAAAFRTQVFKREISFDHDTITEDLDFTYQLHEKGIRILFEKKAIVNTQDPPNIRSYVRQMQRWYGGGWQNLAKHLPIVIKNPSAALELSLTYFEGLIASLVLIITPFINLELFFYRILPFYLLVAFIFSVYASLAARRKDLLLYSPLYFVITFINAVVFISEFFKEIIFKKRRLVWLKADRCKI